MAYDDMAARVGSPSQDDPLSSARRSARRMDFVVFVLDLERTGSF